MKETRTTYVPNNLLFAEVDTQIKQGKKVRIKIRGNSMLPLLRNNDEVLLIPPTENNIKRWMPVVAITDEIGIVMHRIIKIDNEHITLLGDGNVGQIEHSAKDKIIAIVSHFYRGDKTIRTDTFAMRIWSIMWYIVHPYRKKILKTLWNIKNTFNK